MAVRERGDEKEIAQADLSDTTYLSVRWVDDLVDIRKWVKSERYVGPTRQGVRLTLKQVEFLHGVLGGVLAERE